MTVATVQDVRDAICEGCALFVGGKFIVPDEIVSWEFDADDNPKFYLADGTSVTHDPTLEGDVGDLLGDALCGVQRSGSVRFKDPFYDAFFYGKSNDEITFRNVADNSVIKTLTAMAAGLQEVAYDAHNDRLVAIEQATNDLYAVDIDADTRTLLEGTQDYFQFIAVDPTNGQIYSKEDDGVNQRLVRLDDDGTNRTVILDVGASGFDPDASNIGDGDLNDDGSLLFISSQSTDRVHKINTATSAVDVIFYIGGLRAFSVQYEGVDDVVVFADDFSKKIYVVSPDGTLEKESPDLGLSNFGFDLALRDPQLIASKEGYFAFRATANSGGDDQIIKLDSGFNIAEQFDVESNDEYSISGVGFVNRTFA